MMRSRSHSEPESRLLNPQMKQGRRDEVHRVLNVSVRHCFGAFEGENETEQGRK